MVKTATVHARIESDLKSDAEDIFSQLGLTVTEAVTLFYRQVQLRNGLPFAVEIPNAETRQTFEDTDAGRNVVHVADVDALFKALEL